MTKTRLLEVGHGGLPLGFDNVRDLSQVCRARGIDYHGVDYFYASPSARRRSATIMPRYLGEMISTIEEQREAERPNNVHFYRMNAKKLGFRDESFDEVHMNFFVTDPNVKALGMVAPALENARRVLRREGVLLLVGEVPFERRRGRNDVLAESALRRSDFVPIPLTLESLPRQSVYTDLVQDALTKGRNPHPPSDIFAFLAHRF